MNVFIVHCAVPEIILPPLLHRGSLEILGGGGGVSKANTIEKYEATLEFQEGWFKPKKSLSGGDNCIFSGTPQCLLAGELVKLKDCTLVLVNNNK